MDKSWILTDRLSSAYEKGVAEFLEFTQRNNPNLDVIPCPCGIFGMFLICFISILEIMIEVR